MKMTLLLQVVLVGSALAQADLPYPLQLVQLAPSGVSSRLHGPEPHDAALLLGGTHAGTKQTVPGAQHMSQFHSQDAAGRSLFGFMMADQARIEARASDGSVRGSYTYLDPSGRAVKVQYWDEGQGFHAAGNHLPATFPGLPQPVRDTPEVETARRQHLAAYQQVLQRQLQLLYHQQPLQQPLKPAGGAADGEAEEVVVDSDPTAAADDRDDDLGQRYPALPPAPALYDPSHVHDAGREAVIVDTVGARHSLQGSTDGARNTSNTDNLVKAFEHPKGILQGRQGGSGQRFVIIYADSVSQDNNIEQNDEDAPSVKRIRSAQLESNDHKAFGDGNRQITTARRSRRGRITIYDYIAERDPERMARYFPESYLIQQIFNSSREGRGYDDTDNLQRAAEREFQNLHKTGSTENRGQPTHALFPADVVGTDSEGNPKMFYNAGTYISDLSHNLGSNGKTRKTERGGGTSNPGSGVDFFQDFPVANRRNQNVWSSQPSYDDDKVSSATIAKEEYGAANTGDANDKEPSYGQREMLPDIYAYSASYDSSSRRIAPHPVYYPEYLRPSVNRTRSTEGSPPDEADTGRWYQGESTPAPLVGYDAPSHRRIVPTSESVRARNTYSVEVPQEGVYEPGDGGKLARGSPGSSTLVHKLEQDAEDIRGSGRPQPLPRVSSELVARPPISGDFYNGYRDQPAHRLDRPVEVTNVGGYPPVAVQYSNDVSRRSDATFTYRQAATKEAVVLNDLFGRSPPSKARSLDVVTGGAADRVVATKEQLVAEEVASAASTAQEPRVVRAQDTEPQAAGNVVAVPQQRSVVSLKDGPAESYSAVYIQPTRRAGTPAAAGAALPQPQVEGGFFYSFHHPVIPVAVQLADVGAAPSDARAPPPRGLSVSQRASLYDAVPVAAVHDAQVAPYQRGAVADHQTKPLFIHYEPQEGAAA